MLYRQEIDIDISIFHFTDAPMHADPIWHKLPQLHMWFAGKTARPRQVTSHSGPRRRGARTLSSPYGRTPLAVGWSSP